MHAHQKHLCSSAHLLASTLESLNTINASEPLHLFLNPISMPVTYIIYCILIVQLIPNYYFIDIHCNFIFKYFIFILILNLSFNFNFNFKF